MTQRVLAVLVLLGGCSEWPRVANIPDPGPIEDANVDPGDLVEVAWGDLVEPASDNDQPLEVDALANPLARGDGYVVTGALDGIGWADALVADELSDANCPGDTGSRSPLPAGDYLGDVDFVVFEVAESGTLCASVQVDADSVGWDLLPQRTNPCNVPLGPLVHDDGSTVGVDLGGRTGGWSVNVAAGDRIALGFAGYAPNDDTLSVPYDLALSLVSERSDGSEGQCPTHPEAAR